MHQLSELNDLLGAFGKYRVAVELRNRNWAEGDQLKATLDFLRAHSAAFVLVDAPAEKHFTIMPAGFEMKSRRPSSPICVCTGAMRAPT